MTCANLNAFAFLTCSTKAAKAVYMCSQAIKNAGQETEQKKLRDLREAEALMKKEQDRLSRKHSNLLL